MKRTYKILLSEKASTHLRKLDTVVQRQIVKKLKFFEAAENPLYYAEKLKDEDLGDYRFRIGVYRVLFDINERGELCILYVLAIKHRSKAYRA